MKQTLYLITAVTILLMFYTLYAQQMQCKPPRKEYKGECLYQEEIDKRKVQDAEKRKKAAEAAAERRARERRKAEEARERRKAERAEEVRKTASLIKRGWQLVDSGRNDDALIAFREALTLSPNNPNAHLGLGEMYNIMGNTKNALTHYRKYLSLKPNARDRNEVEAIIDSLQ
jgi:tetratricopeptide (TPR) repeat protein